ncbi:MAG: hypothetical protein HQK99_03240 [Nitrospirae bacterium]|nr:hypothetical protein [Nitrospirota bacterium]
MPTDRGVGIWLDPGMLITSYQIISEGVAYSEMGVLRLPSKKTIGKILRWLEKNGQVQIVAGHYGTTIKISNWDKYQPAHYETPSNNSKANGGKRKARKKPDPYAHLYIREINSHTEAESAGS